VEIGRKLKQLRLQRGLTQEELADRCELSKGFISLVERDLTSPSITTLEDMLVSLGSDLGRFFAEPSQQQIVFGDADISVKEDAEGIRGFIRWLVPNAQKNDMEPILVKLGPGGETQLQAPHEGEEFGYVLNGQLVIELGERREKARRDESFCYKPTAPHRIVNPGKAPCTFIWVSTPPTF
jgi:transcriptional regulator with XRE-family HTH domain